MPLPRHITEYLRSAYEIQRRPYCFQIDQQYLLQAAWDPTEIDHFGTLPAGTDMLEYAPFLHGQLGYKLHVLPFVSTADGKVFEVHIIPHEAFHYIVLLDSRSEHDYRQTKQQIANEVQLLHANQQKLIGRQRALISDLVETKAELDHRRREAERSDASKSRFIAMMSHEFRTPLASIVNYADLALEDGTSERDKRKSAEAIARASRHLRLLVDTVLDDARLEAGHVQISERPFDLRALVDDMATIMAPLAAEKGLSFAAFLDGDVPGRILADDVCLRQVLINLLGNAVKYTEFGSIRLDVDWKQNRLTACVSDTGPGIDDTDQERIFQAFERGTSTKGTPGAGLGLSISLELARLMQGRIDLQSTPGSGCRITLSIPAPELQDLEVDEILLPLPEEAVHASRPSSILLCDDDEDMLALCEYYLHRAGYGLLLARDGMEAVEKTLAYHPDLVLLDINLPRLSGADAAVRLRQAGFTNPIVALTASDTRQIDQNAFTAGLRKPIQMPELLGQIKQYLNQPTNSPN